MNKDYILVLLFYILFSSCKGDEIDYCAEYNDGKCVKCEEKCFLFENKCYKCNDKEFGNIGCIGECDGTEYETKKILYVKKKVVLLNIIIFKVFVIVVMFLMKIALDVVMKIKKILNVLNVKKNMY